jgi:o-succinylbenzoate synthase
VKLSTRVVRVGLREPFVTAAGLVRERELALVTLTDSDGAVGHGEAAPLAPIGIEDCVAALKDCRAVLGSTSVAEARAACEQAAVLPPAVAAIDLALWDLESRRAGVPVWRLLVDQQPRSIAVNATIAAADRAGAAAAASAAREAGYGCVKVKVGLGDDAGRLAAVRAAAGPSMAVRIDANGTWTVDQAIAALRALEPVGIELCEEPVHGLDELAAVRAASPVPIALDESGALPGALDRRVADVVCLKIAACGGITGLLSAAERARSAGYEVYVASSLDGPLGIAAALHACAAVRPDRPCGLATLGLFDAPQGNPLPARDGMIVAPDSAGLLADPEVWYPFL